MNKYLKQKKIVALMIAVLILVISNLLVSDFGNDENLYVYYFDVGQGDSALIDSPNGIQVLIDSGKGGQVIDELEKVMRMFDKKIDVLILTHGDLDHIGGFFEILERYEVKKIMLSSVEIDSDYEKNLIQEAQSQNIEISEINQGDKIILDQQRKIYLNTFWPPKDDDLVDENKNSLILELVYGESEFLFTGDATIETELEIIKKFGEEINSDVLKVGHHGSKTSTSVLFLDKVSPEFSILSYGENSYGHPNKEVVDRLEGMGGQIFETKKRATIVARSNGQNLNVSYFSDVQKNFLQEMILIINSLNFKI